MESRNYRSLNLSDPQLIYIFRAYVSWHGVFTKINMEEELPVIRLRITDYDEN